MASDKDKRVLGKMDETYEGGGAPAGVDPQSGQHRGHWILSEEERKKGFVRPVRLSYKHIGLRPKYPTRELTEDEKKQYEGCDYVAYEPYPESEEPVTGSFWTKKRLESGCGTVTSMPRPIAETWARDINFYGGTFCCTCRAYLPVGEFVWLDDDSRLGT